MQHPALKPVTYHFASFAFAWFSCLAVYAQTSQLKFERFGTEQGLPSNVIYSINQDSNGYLWLSTNEGLSRYDGYEFKNFRRDPADTGSIPGNQVFWTFEDNRKNLWVKTDEGLCKFDAMKKTFSRYRVANKVIYAGDQFMPINYQEVLSVGGNVLSTINLITPGFRNLNIPSSFRFVNLCKDNQGNIFVPAFQAEKSDDKNQILRYDPVKRKISSFSKLPFLDRHRESISLLFIDSRNTYWIGSQAKGMIYRCSLTGDSSQPLRETLIQDKVLGVRKIFEDRNGNIWFGTKTGLFIYDYITGRISKHTDQYTHSIFQDHTGSIWLGTFNGLYKLNPAQRGFRNFHADPGSHPRLLKDFILGIWRLPAGKILVNYFDSPEFSILDSGLNTIRHLREKGLGFAEYLKTIVIRDPEKISRAILDKSVPLFQGVGIGNNNDNFILTDRFNRFWMYKGMELQLAVAPGVFETISSHLSDVKMGKNELWFTSTIDGLCRIDLSTLDTTWYRFQARPTGKGSLSSNNLNCLLQETNGNLWIGTKGTGLDYFDRQKNTFINYTQENGLCNNSVFSLVMDDKGRLWIGTGNGLSCLDTASKKFTSFHRSDGLINSEYNRFSACKLPGGHIMMGGLSGIDYFHPDSITKAKAKPQVQITDFKVYNKSIPYGADIELKHTDNSVTIDFAVMDYRNPAANKYAYMLKGIDKDWVMAGSLRSVSYATLSPGRYHFLVKAAGSDGLWNEEPAEIHFTISTPWFRSLWFFVIAGLLTLAVLYSLYRFRIYQLKKVFAVRSKIARDLHDEVGATLTSISYLSEVAKQQPGNEAPAADEAIDKIGEFSRDMIGEMNDIVWAINPANDRFEKIENRMQHFAATLLAAKNIVMDFRGDDQLKDVFLGMQQRKNLYLIFKEAVNNAAKYSGCSQVNISLFKEDHHISMKVEDNGKGFVPEQYSSGNGLNNMRSRAEEIKAKFRIDTEPGKGTRVSVIVPITQNAY